MTTIRVAGIDPSFTHTGVAKFDLDLHNFVLTPVGIDLFITENGAGKKHKGVRKNSDDLVRAKVLYDGLHGWLADCEMAFSEVPHGAQSARAALSNGVCYGLLVSIPCPLIQVQADETKKHTVGKKTASKLEMIAWARKNYPQMSWRMRKLKGELLPVNDNEHMADACGVVVAGIQTDEFKRTATMLKVLRRSSAANMTATDLARA